MEKLKPCPFCGSKKVTFYPNTTMQAQAIYCKDCPGGVEDTTISVEEIFKAWNTRSKPKR